MENMKTVTKRIVTGVLTASVLLMCGINVTNVNAASIEQEETTSQDSVSAEMSNSIAMLNYLTVVNQQINESSNSKLYLEDVYSSLINNTSPNAVDDRTQIQLGDMLDTIDQYRMIDVKRDRLLYVYEQNKAQALRDAVPNPLGLLSSVQSLSWPKLIASITYRATVGKAYSTI